MKSHGSVLRFAFFGLVAAFSAATALAQSDKRSSESSLKGRLRIAGEGSDAARGAMLLVSREGAVVGRAAVSRSGLAEIHSLPSGTYSVTVVSPGGMAAFGLAVPADAPAARFDVLMVPSRDVAAARRHLAVGPLQRSAERTAASKTQAAEPVEPLAGESVTVPRGETIGGRLTVVDSSTAEPQPLAGADVLFLQRGSLAAAARTDDDGRYTMPPLEEGIYSMVASGEKGFFAAGVKIESAGIATSGRRVPSDDTEFVAMKKPASPSFAAMGASADAAPFAPGLAKRAGLIASLATGAAKGNSNVRGNAFGRERQEQRPVSPNGPPIDPPGPPFEPPGPPPDRPPHDPPGPPPGRPPGRS